MKAKVSINIPLYGNFNRNRLGLVLDSIVEQDYAYIEVVVSEQNPAPYFLEECNNL